MDNRWILAAGLGVAMGAALAVAVGPAKPAAALESRDGGGLVTLHRLDPVTHTLNLATGRHGGRIEGAAFIETRAHLDYGVYAEDMFTVALEEDDRGAILDLGLASELPERYDFEEVIGGGRGYASIRLDGDRLAVRKNFPDDAFQHMESGRLLFPTHADANLASAPVAEGHVYVVRVRRKEASGDWVWAKLLVVAHEPGRWVTVRWDPL